MTEILGRQAELAAIGAFLTDRAGEARALVLEGEPGIGKTTLWRWAVANAESEGVIVLRAQPAELEQDLAFATLGDLLAEALDEIEALPEPQRRALRIALLLEESDGRLLDERAVGTALATLLRELAGDGLALLAIDDAQWADPSSWGLRPFRVAEARCPGQGSPDLPRGIHTRSAGGEALGATAHRRGCTGARGADGRRGLQR